MKELEIIIFFFILLNIIFFLKLNFITNKIIVLYTDKKRKIHKIKVPSIGGVILFKYFTLFIYR